MTLQHVFSKCQFLQCGNVCQAREYFYLKLGNKNIQHSTVNVNFRFWFEYTKLLSTTMFTLPIGLTGHSEPPQLLFPHHEVPQWASCQIRKIAGCACAENAFSPPPTSKETAISNSACMSGSLRGNVPGIPGACATRNCTYLQEAHDYALRWFLSIDWNKLSCDVSDRIWMHHYSIR